MPNATTHEPTARRVVGGHLAVCQCGWRAAFPSFSEHVARGHAARHYLAAEGAGTVIA